MAFFSSDWKSDSFSHLVLLHHSSFLFALIGCALHVLVASHDYFLYGGWLREQLSFLDAGFRLSLQDVFYSLVFRTSNQSSSNFLSIVAGSHTVFVLLSLSRFCNHVLYFPIIIVRGKRCRIPTPIPKCYRSGCHILLQVQPGMQQSGFEWLDEKRAQ